MPIHTFDAPPTADAPAPPKPPKTVVCTIAEADSGDTCSWCGWPSGYGHGKERG